MALSLAHWLTGSLARWLCPCSLARLDLTRNPLITAVAAPPCCSAVLLSTPFQPSHGSVFLRASLYLAIITLVYSISLPRFHGIIHFMVSIHFIISFIISFPFIHLISPFPSVFYSLSPSLSLFFPLQLQPFTVPSFPSQPSLARSFTLSFSFPLTFIHCCS